jgi:hypothetical protein
MMIQLMLFRSATQMIPAILLKELEGKLEEGEESRVEPILFTLPIQCSASRNRYVDRVQHLISSSDRGRDRKVEEDGREDS